MKIQAGKETVLATGTLITFAEAMDGADYSLMFRCYDPVTLDTTGCTIDPLFTTVNGFKAIPLDDAVLEYQAQDIGAAESSAAAQYQSGRENVSTGGTTVTFASPMYSNEYSLVFRCYNPTTLATIGCRVDPAFFTTTSFRAVPVTDAVIEYHVQLYGSGPISLLPQSGRLSRDWTAQAFYAELVRDLGLTTQQALYGERFNIINRAIPKAVLAHSALLGNTYKSSQSTSSNSASTLTISALRIQMGGPEQRFVIESDATKYVDQVEFEDYRLFRASAFQNTGRIIWTKEGDTILFAKGGSLTNYGTRTFRYSRMPEPVTGNEELVDFPDSFMHLAFIEGKRILAERYKINVQYPEESGEQATKKAMETGQLEPAVTPIKAL